MKERLEKRLEELQDEYQKGQQQLEQLEQESNNVRTSMLRISGAIQVLREELGISEENNMSESKNGIETIKQ